MLPTIEICLPLTLAIQIQMAVPVFIFFTNLFITLCCDSLGKGRHDGHSGQGGHGDPVGLGGPSGHDHDYDAILGDLHSEKTMVFMV